VRATGLRAYGDEKVADRTVRDSVGDPAHAAVSPRPPLSLYTIVVRTHMYTFAAKVWDLSIVQGPFPVAPCVDDSRRFHRCRAYPISATSRTNHHRWGVLRSSSSINGAHNTAAVGRICHTPHHGGIQIDMASPGKIGRGRFEERKNLSTAV
jgi:hypothetical protein